MQCCDLKFLQTTDALKKEGYSDMAKTIDDMFEDHMKCLTKEGEQSFIIMYSYASCKWKPFYGGHPKNWKRAHYREVQMA